MTPHFGTAYRGHNVMFRAFELKMSSTQYFPSITAGAAMKQIPQEQSMLQELLHRTGGGRTQQERPAERAPSPRCLFDFGHCGLSVLCLDQAKTVTNISQSPGFLVYSFFLLLLFPPDHTNSLPCEASLSLQNKVQILFLPALQLCTLMAAC